MPCGWYSGSASARGADGCGGRRGLHLPAEEAAARLGKRFAIVNLWRPIGSAVENAAIALMEIQSPNIPESQKACLVDFGEIASAMQAEDENDIALAQVLDIFYRRWPGIRFQGSDVAKFLGSGEHAAEDDIKTICAFLDPSGKRGAEISPVSIGMTLKGKQNCPVQCDNLELTLRWKSTGTRKPAWMWVEAKARAA